MAKTTALVIVSGVFVIGMIAVVGMGTGHNTSLATGGIAAISATLTGVVAYLLGRKKSGT